MATGITNSGGGMQLPIGSIHMSVNSANPADYFGYGVWQRFANGKVLVGIDETDNDFNTSQKTGGSKASNMPAHTHGNKSLTGFITLWQVADVDVQSGGFVTKSNPSQTINSIGNSRVAPSVRFDINASHEHTSQGTGSTVNGNMPPYIAVYMWVRTG